MNRTILLAFAALAFLPLLAACSSTPETHLSWDVNDRLSNRKAPVRTAAAPKNTSASGPRVYVYQDPGEVISAPPVPTPRPAYGVASNPRPQQASYRPVAPAPVTGNASFAWPVSGEVISGFGTARNGERNDGINIAARHNTAIRAAASGTVNYSGALNGYGNLLLIRHPNGYVTAYAHADRLLVAQGDYVAKGQVIGYVGSTGDVPTPQLHFEIRNGTTPVDPQRYLSGRAGA